MAKQELDVNDHIREIRSLTDLLRASLGQIADEDSGRPIDRTAMTAWNATHGVYRVAGSMEEVQAQITEIINAKMAAATALIIRLVVEVARREEEDVTLLEVIDRIEKQVIEGLSTRESDA